MMDHVRAQQLISDALDELAVDRFELVEAKEHCRECPQCAAYVRALIAVQRTPLPEPPEDLADRVMTQVRAEAQARAIARARALAAPKRSRGPEEPVTDRPPARTFRDLTDRALDPRNRRSLVIWGSVAATVFILAGWGAIAGVRTILIPPRLSEITITGGDSATNQHGTAATVPESAPGRMGAGDKAAPATAAPSMIEVSGSVYLLRGANTTVDVDELKRVGQTRTALDTGKRPQSYDVLSGDDPLQVYIVTDAGTLEFEAITRTYEERSYVLKGGPVDAYGEWPSLPAGVTEPTAPDGSPTFAVSGPDANSVTIHTLANRTADSGIAVAPNPPSPDPVAGSPNWTFWAPLQ